MEYRTLWEINQKPMLYFELVCLNVVLREMVMMSYGFYSNATYSGPENTYVGEF